jgi:hypothetical protein
MEKDLNSTLENERALLLPLQLDNDKELQEVANEDSLWIYGLQDLSKSGELNKYIRQALADRETIKEQYFTNFKAIL